MRILVIEDEVDIADIIRRELVENHYSVDIAHNGSEGSFMALTNDYDLIILDIRLPKKSGWDVCREIRSQGSTTPILMLTALDGTEDVVSGLDLGADDYLKKPFDSRVLLARARSLMRRRFGQPETVIRVGSLVIDTARRVVERNGRPIALTAKEFALLEFLAMNKGKVMSREQISEHVWDMNFDPRSNVIDSLIRHLRMKITSDDEAQLIDAVRGIGYRLNEDENVES